MRWYLLLYLLSSLSFTALSQPVILPLRDELPLLGKQVDLYEDPSGTLGIGSVSSDSIRARFTRSEVDAPNFNVTHSTVWAHLRIALPDNEPYYLMVDPPSLRHVALFTVHKDGSIDSAVTGVFLPASSRQINTNHFLFRLSGGPGDTVDYFIRASNYEPLQFIIRAGRTEQFVSGIQREDMINLFCFGLAMMMLIYNLFLYVTSREKVYLFYVTYIFFNCYFTSFITGYLYYFPSLMQDFVEYAAACCPGIMAVFGVLFSIHFLNTKKLAPGYHRLLLINMWIVVGIMLLALLGFHQASIMAMEFIGFVFGTSIILTAIHVYRKGYKPALFLLVGYGFYMVSLCVFILMNLHVLPISGLTMNSLQIGTCIEITFFSFALGDKMNVLKGEKEKATENALRSSLENERLVREQNALLETKVKERTAEVVRQKEVIEEKNRDIISSIEYARRIQRSLLPTERYIARTLEKLKR